MADIFCDLGRPTCRKLVIQRIGPKGPAPHTLKLAKRFRIIGVEIVGLAAFLLFIMLLQLVESSWNPSIEQFAIVYAIIGITLILVGLESLSLNRRLPMK